MNASVEHWVLAVAALFVALPALAEPEAGPQTEASAPAGERREADEGRDGFADRERDKDAAEEADEVADEQEAEDEAEPSEGVEEIIVEGSTTKIGLDVPTSVTTFSGSDVQELRIQDIADLSAYTPNLEINTAFAASNPTLFIRGIGLKDYNANSASAVAVYQDGIAINSPAGQLFQLFDVESVQVLRGPQGSLSGRNATAGAIHVDSVKPDGEWSSAGSFVYGNYNNVELEGALGFPLIDEMLSGRVAFTFQRRDGITENGCAGHEPPPDLEPNLDGSVDSFRMTAETLEAEYAKDIASGFLDPDIRRNYYQSVDTKWGGRQAALDAAGLDRTAKRLLNDNICVVESPYRVVTQFGEDAGKGTEGSAVRVPNVPDLGDFAGLKSRTNNADNWALRGMLRAQPTSGMDLLFNAHGGRNRSDSFHMQMVGAKPLSSSNNPTTQPPPITDQRYAQSGNSSASGNWNEVAAGEKPKLLDGLQKSTSAGPVPGGKGGADPYLGWYNRDGLEELDLMGFSLTARQEFDAPAWWVPSLLTSISGYEANERSVDVDGDGSPSMEIQGDYFDETWQVTQELRIEGEGERFWWVVGGYFFYEELESENFFPGALGRNITQAFTQQTTSFAPFVHGRFDFTDDLLRAGVPDWLASWSLEAGARYNWENKVFELGSEVIVAETGTGAGLIAPQGDEMTWKGVTGDVTLSYMPFQDRLFIDDMTLYGKFSRGMKGGHFNAGLTVNPGRCKKITGTASDGCQTITPVEPEFINAVEVGAKLRAFDGRLQLSAAWFQYWYQDLQVFDIVNDVSQLPTQQLLNSDAAVMGAELELSAHPLSGLSEAWNGILDGFFVQFGGGWLDTEFIDFMVTKTAFQAGPRRRGFVNQFDYDGNPLIAAPSWNFSGVAEWEIPLWHWGSLVPSYNFSYRSRISLDPSNDELLSQPGYWLHSARLAYRTPGGRIEIAGWVDNFMDEAYLVDVFDLTRQFRTFLQVWGQPRMYGLNLSYLW